MIFSPISTEATGEGIRKQLAEQHRVSTDPNWLAPKDHAQSVTVGPGGETGAAACQPGPVLDGRHGRKAKSRALMLAACRDLMSLGEYRPSMDDICAAAGASVRNGYEIFGNTDALRIEALQDADVRNAILEHACGPLDLPEATRWRIMQAIVTGKAG